MNDEYLNKAKSWFLSLPMMVFCYGLLWGLLIGCLVKYFYESSI